MLAMWRLPINHSTSLSFFTINALVKLSLGRLLNPRDFYTAAPPSIIYLVVYYSSLPAASFRAPTLPFSAK
jgi:hypothetical protein